MSHCGRATESKLCTRYATQCAPQCSMMQQSDWVGHSPPAETAWPSVHQGVRSLTACTSIGALLVIPPKLCPGCCCAEPPPIARPIGGAYKSEHVKSMSRACQEHVKSMSRVCQEHVKSMSRACQEHVKSVSRACQEHVKSVSRACQERVKSMSGVCVSRVCQQSVSAECVKWGSRWTVLPDNDDGVIQDSDDGG